MKRIFFIYSVFFLLLSCRKEASGTLKAGWSRISHNVSYKNTGGFYELVSGSHRYRIAESRLPFKKTTFLNASLLGYVAELGLENKVAGVASPEYIFSGKLQQDVSSGKIQNLGNEQKYDIEKIIAMKPDAVFTNYISTFENTYDLLKKNGIEIIFLDEYLEQNPLEKAAYLKVFGKLLGAEGAAARRYSEIAANYSRYRELAAAARIKPMVLANEMYGNQWFVAGGKSALAKLIADAGANYILKDNNDSNSVPMSFEEVFAKSSLATFWVNVGNHSAKKELLQINPNYAKMNVYNHGQLYALTQRERGKANDYFESGVVQVDEVLKDYIKIFHPEIFPGEPLRYMKKLR